MTTAQPNCSTRCSSCPDDERCQAETEAATVAATLGEDWTTSVWCNLGWHWEVVSGDGRFHVRASFRRSRKDPITEFTAELRGPEPLQDGWPYHNMRHTLQWFGIAKTPQAAIAKAIQAAKADVQRMLKAVEGL